MRETFLILAENLNGWKLMVKLGGFSPAAILHIREQIKAVSFFTISPVLARYEADSQTLLSVWFVFQIFPVTETIDGEYSSPIVALSMSRFVW